MKYILGIIIICIQITISITNIYANKDSIDSLEKVLSNSQEKESIKILFDISKEYIHVDLNKSLNYAGKALELSNKYNEEELIAYSNLHIADTYYEMSRFQSAIEFYETALDYFYEQKSSENKIYIYTKLGDAEKMLSNYSNALFYYQKPLNLYLAQNNTKISIAYNNIGTVYKLIGDFNQSLYFYQKALNASNMAFDQNEIANTLKLIGSVYWRTNQYDSSLFFYEKSLEVYRENTDTIGEAITLSNIGILYKDIGEFQKALDYNKKALELRLATNNKKEIANSYNSIGSIYLSVNDLENALDFYEKSLRIRESIYDILGIAQSQKNISLVYRKKNDFVIALEYLNKALRNYKNIGNKSYIANSINEIGNLHKRLQHYDLALKSYLDAIKINQEIGDQNKVASILNNIGIIYSDISNYSKALESFSKSLEIKRELGNKKEISYSLHIIGNTYLNLKNYTEALNYYNEALAIRTEIGDKINIASSLKNIGNTYLKQGDFQNAIKNLKESYKIRQELGDIKGTSDILNDIANFYIETNQQIKALAYLKQTMELSNKTGDQYLTALSKRKIGVIKLEQGEINNGIELINESLQIGQNIDNLELIKFAYFELYNFYVKTGNKNKALENYVNYTLIKDSINSRLNSQRLIEIQMNFELEESQSEINRIENEITQLSAENKIRELELKKQKNVRNFLFIIAVISLLSGIIILYQFLNKKKTNLLLKEKIKEVDKSNLLLKESEEDLKTLNATKDKFFSIIAHDLRNPFNALHGLTQHLINNFDSFEQDEIKQSIEIIYSSADDLLELLENLLHWSRTQRGKMKFSPKEINLFDLINKNFHLLSMNADKKNINLINEIIPDKLITADYDMLTAILRNLISNAIKFSHNNSFIRVSAKENKDYIEISVMDNGIGISEEDIKKLFRIDIHYSTSGTSQEQGSGLGLILCKEFVENHNGEIWVESKLREGSIFKFTISKNIKG